MAASTRDTELRELLAELEDLRRVALLLSWDQQTVMPPGGVPARALAAATIDRIRHERLTGGRLGEALQRGAAAGDGGLLRVVSRDREIARRVPGELVADISRAGNEARAVWERARATDDFALFAPALERNVELRRRYADCFPDVEHPYDALLDRYEPGARTSQVRAAFAQLTDGLVPLIAAIAAAPAPPALPGPFPIAQQRQLAREIVQTIGFDDEAWRVDDATHPFEAALARGDVRVTGRYATDSLTGVFALMHEVGHGLYEHQVDPALDGTTLGSGASMGIHESQSRLWENLVGRSLPFWRHWLPRARELLGDALGGLELEDFYRALNVVVPSLIRVEADEVTYSLHVVMRFELEVALIEGSLSVSELPEVWSSRTHELLGIEVPDDTHGVLQDVHWALGELGYFPTYALGNMIAAQLMASARQALGDLDAQMSAGDLAPLAAWLGENVHRPGRTFDPDELVQRVTGSPPTPEPMLDYLWKKYGEIYSLGPRP